MYAWSMQIAAAAAACCSRACADSSTPIRGAVALRRLLAETPVAPRRARRTASPKRPWREGGRASGTRTSGSRCARSAARRCSPPAPSSCWRSASAPTAHLQPGPRRSSRAAARTTGPTSVVMVWHSRPGFGRCLASPSARPSHAGAISAYGALQDLAATRSWEGNLESRFDVVAARRRRAAARGARTPNFFTVLGARPLHGRVFTNADEDAGMTSLVVLGHGLWQRAFGGDHAIVGRTVTFVSGRRDRAAAACTSSSACCRRRSGSPIRSTPSCGAILPWAEINADPGARDPSTTSPSRASRRA